MLKLFLVLWPLLATCYTLVDTEYCELMKTRRNHAELQRLNEEFWERNRMEIRKNAKGMIYAAILECGAIVRFGILSNDVPQFEAASPAYVVNLNLDRPPTIQDHLDLTLSPLDQTLALNDLYLEFEHGTQLFRVFAWCYHPRELHLITKEFLPVHGICRGRAYVTLKVTPATGESGVIATFLIDSGAPSTLIQPEILSRLRVITNDDSAKPLLRFHGVRLDNYGLLDLLPPKTVHGRPRPRDNRFDGINVIGMDWLLAATNHRSLCAFPNFNIKENSCGTAVFDANPPYASTPSVSRAVRVKFEEWKAVNCPVPQEQDEL